MLSTLSQETIHVGVLDAYDIVHVDKFESLERVGVSSRIDVRCLGAAICGLGGRPLFAVSITGPLPRFTLEACVRHVPALLSVDG